MLCGVGPLLARDIRRVTDISITTATCFPTLVFCFVFGRVKEALGCVRKSSACSRAAWYIFSQVGVCVVVWWEGGWE